MNHISNQNVVNGVPGGSIGNIMTDIISSLVINGDISRLNHAQKVNYYKQICDKLGLDPISQPFRILRLHGREILYCDRGGAQQLNKLHKLSHRITARETVNGCYLVTAQASTPDGRTTESIGAVNISYLKGEALCNAMMKAETKAKRRATLDLLGLGILDETEVPPQGQDVEHATLDMQAQTAKAVTENTSPAGRGREGAGIPTSLYLGTQGLHNEIERCRTEEALISLYNENRPRVDGDRSLIKHFTQRRDALRNTQAAA